MEIRFEMDEGRSDGRGFIERARMLKVSSTRRYERYGDRPSWQS